MLIDHRRRLLFLVFQYCYGTASRGNPFLPQQRKQPLLFLVVLLITANSQECDCAPQDIEWDPGSLSEGFRTGSACIGDLPDDLVLRRTDIPSQRNGPAKWKVCTRDRNPSPMSGAEAGV